MTIRIPDNGSRGCARLGLVVPVHNTNFESDMILLRPQGVSLHVMRVGGYDLDKMPDPELMREFALSSLEEVISALSATTSGRDSVWLHLRDFSAWSKV